MQSDLFAFDLARVTGDEAGLAQGFSQGLIVGYQCPGDPMTDGAGLAGNASALDGDIDIELIGHVDGLQRLPDNHSAGLPSEVLIQGTVVDGDIAGALFKVDPGGGTFAASGAVIGLCCHIQISSDFGCCAVCLWSAPA